ncbi:MAG TPA: YihY/virulence factor BrkB family protein [Candidatus Eubacterium avistercoris]|uniref:YihY/virulence factor BrkB family protein n=1 Tax=Candidatus Eubacterium avistercoris TaxID=2838567 RepID=A0A9D2D2B7_9FIRM|nr:YihY/virulence factor BrkB family protein [Candidatus Eubacterium avistercoris]
MKRYVPIIRFFLDKLKRDNVGAYAGQATLFIIMSVIPFLLVLTYLMRFTPVTESVVLNAIEKVAPGMVAPYLVSILDEVYNNSGKLLVAAIIIAVYSSAKAVQSLRYGLNIVYDIYETRNWFVLRLRAMLETFTLILIMILLMVMLVFGQRIQDVLVQHAPIVSIVTDWILRLRFVIIFLILIAFFAFIYKVIPNRKASFRSQLVGAVGCAAAWYVFTFGLSIYVNYFRGFSLYGSLTTLLLMMFWLYICMYIFMVCGEVNNVFEVIWLEIKEAREKKKLQKLREKQNKM